MANLKAAFEAAVAASKSLPEKPDNMTLLKIYALYKQGSSGDVGASGFVGLCNARGRPGAAWIAVALRWRLSP